jgi:hypothetical protein
MNHYAEIDGGGVCFAQLQTEATLALPTMILNPGGARRIGQRWDGAAWQDVPLTVKEQAKLELDQIDRDTGIPRALREVLIAIGTKTGADVAYLAGKEAAAGIARGKLK